MVIIKCPYCTLYGEKRNLAEVIPGGLKLMRSINGLVEYTIVKTNLYSVICGSCGNEAAYRGSIVPVVPTTLPTNWGTIYAFYAKNSHLW